MYLQTDSANVKIGRKKVIFFDIANSRFRVREASFLLLFHANNIVVRGRKAAVGAKEALFTMQTRLLWGAK